MSREQILYAERKEPVMKFSEILPKIVNNPGFKSLNEIKSAGYRIVKERDGGRYFLAKKEELKPLLVRLGDIADVRFGIKTGANDFFYLRPVEKTVKDVVEIGEKNPNALIKVQNGAGWKGEIEAKFLKPVIKSPRELKTIVVKIEDLNFFVFMCHKSKKELQGTKALKYIEWGENEGYHKRPTCRSRVRWWDLGNRNWGKVLWAMIHNERVVAYLNLKQAVVDHNLFEIIHKNFYEIWACLSSSCTAIFRELYGRSNLGEGALKTEGIDIKRFYIIYPSLFVYKRKLIVSIANRLDMREGKSIFLEFGFNEKQPIRSQQPNPLPDRKVIDEILFDALGLTEEERKEVYWTVATMVKNRLDKAKSI